MGISSEAINRIRYSSDVLPNSAATEEDQFSKWSESVRRSLFSGAVLVSPEITPGVHQAVSSVLEYFSEALRVEAFVKPDPIPQAYCVHIDSKGHVGLVITSALVNLLDEKELRFVVGHELGHYLFRHYLNRSPENAEGDLDFQSVLHASRVAEISADRIGFLVSPSIEDAFRAMLKVASGLSADKLKLNVASYLSQLREIKDMRNGVGERASTHPIFPIRARALLWFSMCDSYYVLSGRVDQAPLKLADVDRHIVKDMADVEGSAFDATEENALQSVAIWAALSLAGADRHISRGEQGVIASFVDAARLEKCLNYLSSGHPDVGEAIDRKFIEALARAKGGRPDRVRDVTDRISRLGVALGAETKETDDLIIRVRSALLR